MAEPNTPYSPGAMSEPVHSSSTARTSSNGGARGSGFVGRVRERAAAQLESQKDKATDGIGTVVNAVRQSGEQLRSEHHEVLAGYMEKAADQVDRFSRRLREKDVTEILDDAQRLARRQPAVFIGSAFALGLIGARFLKSSRTSAPDRGWEYGSGSSGQQGTQAVASPASTVGAGDVGEIREPLPSAPAYSDVVENDLSRPTPTTRGAASPKGRRTSGTER